MDDATQKKYEDRDMSGTLFANEYKGEHDHKQPSARGTVMVAGKKYHVAAWTRFNSVTGKKYLSLKLEDYETWAKERESAKAQRDAATPSATAGDEDLPF